MHRIRRIIARFASWTEQPYTIIALIAVLLAVIGIVLVGDSSRILAPGFSAREAGYMAFSFAAEIVLFALIIDQLLLRGERRQWKKVEDTVIDLIKTELTKTFFDVADLLGLIADLRKDARLDTQFAAKMKRLADDRSELEKIIDPKLAGIDGASAFSLFSRRAKKLGDMQVRYSFRFLNPELLKTMIDLEKTLETVHSDASIVSKRGMFGQTYRNMLFSHLRELLELLVQAVNHGWIEMGPLEI